MDTRKTFKSDFPQKYEQFIRNSYFIDVKLVSEIGEYNAHKIVLARYSTWFEKTFKDLPADAASLQLPCDPEGAFALLLEIIYTNAVKISVKTAPALLKVAVAYEFPDVIEQVQKFIDESTSMIENEEIILYYVSKFIEYGLIDDAQKLAPKFAKYLSQMIANGGKAGIMSMDRMYRSVSDGRVFASILIDPQVIDKWSEEQKVEQIDIFHSMHPELKEPEKEALANPSIVNWSNENSYRYLVHYVCDWLPAKISRPLYRKIFNIRAANSRVFEKDCETASAKLSRWFPFSWCSCIADSVVTQSTPVVDAIKFITKLGGALKNPIDPEKYGLINPIPVTKLKEEILFPHLMNNIFFDDKRIFQVICNQKQLKTSENAIIIDFGTSAVFKPKSLKVDFTHSPFYNEHVASYFKERKIHYPSHINVITSINSKSQEKAEVTNAGPQAVLDTEFNTPFTSIIINPPTDDFFFCFKVRYVDFTGCFSQNSQ